MHPEVVAKYEDALAGVRSMDRWKQPVFRHSDVEYFETAPSLASGIHTIYEGGLPIDLYVDLKPGQPLVIFLNGAAPRSEAMKLPVFAGFGVVPPGEVSRLCINDPSLYLDVSLPLAWYAGSAKQPALQALLSRVIGTVVALADTRQVVFVGGSGGGFASLYYSRLVPESLAVVWNPQTDILAYAPQHVAEYSRAAFGLADMEVARRELPARIATDLCALYRGSTPSNHILYLQNGTDWHVKSHCQPFLAALGHQVSAPLSSGKLGESLYLHVGAWGEGHVPAPQPLLKSLLADLLEHRGGWKELFAGERLEIMLDVAEAATTAAA
ncbi:hypothetical protein PO002_04945 [Cupriavidus necator]|uniref:hypothetical protein n=1 Tax=Cupriavidus necator TaxID=106590 RepID=UPI0039C20A35